MSNAAIPVVGIALVKVKLYVPIELETAAHFKEDESPEIDTHDRVLVFTDIPIGTVKSKDPPEAIEFIVLNVKVKAAAVEV